MDTQGTWICLWCENESANSYDACLYCNKPKNAVDNIDYCDSKDNENSTWICVNCKFFNNIDAEKCFFCNFPKAYNLKQNETDNIFNFESKVQNSSVNQESSISIKNHNPHMTTQCKRKPSAVNWGFKIGDILRLCHKEHSHYALYLGTATNNVILRNKLSLDINDPDEYVIHKYTDASNLTLNRLMKFDGKNGMLLFSNKKCCVTLDPLRILWDSYDHIINETYIYDSLMFEKYGKKCAKMGHEMSHTAIEFLGKTGYNLLFENCEHFVTYLRYGHAISRQSNVIMKAASQGAACGALIGTGIAGGVGAAVGSAVGALTAVGASTYAINGVNGIKNVKNVKGSETSELQFNFVDKDNSIIGFESMFEEKEENSLLINMFECEMCHMTMNNKDGNNGQIRLYQCRKCLMINSKDNNKNDNNNMGKGYYCIDCLFMFHSRNEECRKHIDELFPQTSNNNRNYNDDLSLLLKELNLDVMTGQQARQEGMIEFQMCLRDYIEKGYNETWNEMNNNSINSYVKDGSNPILMLSKYLLRGTNKTYSLSQMNLTEIFKNGNNNTLVNMEKLGCFCQAFCFTTAGILLACDLGITIWKYHKNEITWKQLQTRSFDNLIGVTCNFFAPLFGNQVCKWIIQGIITLIGGAINPSLIPTAISVGGMIGTWLGNLVGNWIAKKCNPNNKEKEFEYNKNMNQSVDKQKLMQINEALTFFDFSNIQQLNQEKLRKKYFEMAKLCHPDRNVNTNNQDYCKQFVELTVKYGILKSLIKSQKQDGTAKAKKQMDSFVDDVMSIHRLKY